MRKTDKEILKAELARAAHVWLLKTDAVDGTERAADSASILSPDESVAYNRLRFADDRHLYLVSHVMLRRVLSLYADVDPAAWRFSRNPHGRPEIAAPAIDFPLRFNLTHTRGLAACVVTAGIDCGVDTEQITQRRYARAIARRMFADSEQQALDGLDGQDYLERFFTYWILREAYCKARGTGLAYSGGGFRFENTDAGSWHVRHPEDRSRDTGWQFALQRVFDNWLVAVALGPGNGAALEVRFRDFEF